MTTMATLFDIQVLVSYLVTTLRFITIVYYGYGMPFLAALATYQETKIWNSTSALPSLTIWGLLKVFCFNWLWMTGCLISVIIILTRHILTFGRSDVALDAYRYGEDWVARLVVWAFLGRVQIDGLEHLSSLSSANDDDNNDKTKTNSKAKKDNNATTTKTTTTTTTTPAPIYIANHGSQIDVAVVYYAIQQRFKWIAKHETVYLPGVGQLMYLADHVFIYRKTGKNKESVSNLFDKSNQAIQSGTPMFFFPQGTRRIAEIKKFKDGAFIVAQTNAAPLIPLSINIPTNAWNASYNPLMALYDVLFAKASKRTPTITITVHPPVQVTGKEDRARLKQHCHDVIYSVLPKDVYGCAGDGNDNATATASADDARNNNDKKKTR